MDRVRIAATAAALAALAALAASAQAQPAVAPAFGMTAAEVGASVAKTQDGLATYSVPTGTRGPVTIVAHRLKTGDAEVHDGVNDILVGRSGKASVLVGGALSGQRQTTPGEWRGGTIQGARSYPLNPGDVVWIPAGLPHHVIVPKGAEVTYFAFKSPK